LKIVLLSVGSLAFIVAVYFLPPVHSRLSWRVQKLRESVYYFFNPPEKNVFVPGQQAEMESLLHQTQTAMALTVTATLEPSLTPTNYVSPTPTQTATPLPTATPIPDSVRLKGVVWENQKLYGNNCGPANLSMALSYWGWEGNQTVTASWLKPVQDDRNVMPEELVAYVATQTDLNAVLRWGGDMDLLKKLIAAGYPVIVERGFDEVPERYWLGHYGVITGYDDDKGTVVIQDSYVSPDYERSYEYLEYHWREFNYVYIVIYPSEHHEKVFDILGPHADETYNLNHAAEKALEDIARLSGDDLFFAWFNRGSSLRRLYDYFGAAQAFDEAYAILDEKYPGVDPYYRILWYQTDPYFAYYWTGRYEDVLRLANRTIKSSFVPAIEETWVWRGRAKAALGDTEGAIEDFRTALEWHPDWWVALAELNALGASP